MGVGSEKTVSWRVMRRRQKLAIKQQHARRFTAKFIVVKNFSMNGGCVALALPAIDKLKLLQPMY